MATPVLLMLCVFLKVRVGFEQVAYGRQRFWWVAVPWPLAEKQLPGLLTAEPGLVKEKGRVCRKLAVLGAGLPQTSGLGEHGLPLSTLEKADQLSRPASNSGQPCSAGSLWAVSVQGLRPAHPASAA